jgi:DNA-binding beta-propeller fold protein YncE
VTVHPSGKFAYVTNAGSNNISGYTINPSTGALTAIAGSPFAAGFSPISVAVDPNGKFAYVANWEGNNVSGYTINPNTGALTAIAGSPFAAGTRPFCVTVMRSTLSVHIQITATASGSRTPPTAVGESVVNGDFLIVRNREPGFTTGDGSDEETSWTFDFNEDPNYRDFESRSGPLTSALLTLTLTPKNEGITSDVVFIETLSLINAPEIQTLPVDVTSTITIELLDKPSYTSTAIIGIFFSSIEGRILMRYLDDAIISWAKLELTREDQVP